MASQRSSRRSRKRRGPGAAAAAPPSPGGGPVGAYGERPPSPFGGLPVSEFAILAGIVALIFGAIRHGGLALIVGVIVCLIGVTEVTAREHFSGYRSHTVLLAAIPAVVVEFAIALAVGTPAVRLLLLVPSAAVFGICAWFLRKRFLIARQARMATPAKRQQAAG